MIVDERGRTGLVRPARAARRRRQPARAALPRQAGADLVAGHGHAVGVRARRGRDRRPLLPRARHRARRQRLPDGHPRVLADRRTATRCSRSTRRSAIHLPGHARGPALRRCSTRSSSRSTCAPAWSSGSGTPTATSRSPSRTRRPRTAPPTTPSTSTRSSRCAGGKVLISARDTSAIYKLDRASGRIVWTLGGKASDFELGKGARFFFQHDAQLRRQRPGEPVRRRGGAAAVRALLARAGAEAPPPSAQGDRGAGLPPPGRHLGPERGQPADARPTAASSSAGARSRSSASSPRAGGCCSTPTCPSTTAPTASTASPGRRRRGRAPVAAVATAPTPPMSTVYASWNGATEVDRWRVMAGDSPDSLAPLDHGHVAAASRRGSTSPARRQRVRGPGARRRWPQARRPPPAVSAP